MRLLLVLFLFSAFYLNAGLRPEVLAAPQISKVIESGREKEKRRKEQRPLLKVTDSSLEKSYKCCECISIRALLSVWGLYRDEIECKG